MSPAKRALVCALALSSLSAQTLEFRLVPREDVERRLRTFTTKNIEREPAVRRLFEEAGCAGTSLMEQHVPRVKAPNLICTLSGETESTIVVGAHFDLVEAGAGVVDNWTGASLLASLYQGHASEPRRHTFLFIAFSGEERGLLGSSAFVKSLGKRPTRVKAMVNMDTLGLGESEVWLTHADKTLAKLMGTAAATMRLPVTAMSVDNIGTTDSEPFRDHKIPAITIHSLTLETLPVLHSSKDRLDAVDLSAYYDSYKLLQAYLALLDQEIE